MVEFVTDKKKWRDTIDKFDRRKNAPDHRALRILRNIPKRMIATVRHQGDVESDTLMKSAVKCMTILSRSYRTSNKVMVEAWKLYLQAQNLSGKIPQKFLDNDHNHPMRVETSNKVRIKGMDWSKFYSTHLKPFDQYYRHGGNWRYGRWKSQKKN